MSPHQLLLITALKQGDWQEREEWDVCVVGSKVVCICGQWHDCALCQGGLLCGCIGMCEVCLCMCVPFHTEQAVPIHFLHVYAAGADCI